MKYENQYYKWLKQIKKAEQEIKETKDTIASLQSFKYDAFQIMKDVWGEGSLEDWQNRVVSKERELQRIKETPPKRTVRCMNEIINIFQANDNKKMTYNALKEQLPQELQLSFAFALRSLRRDNVVLHNEFKYYQLKLPLNLPE